MFAPHDRWVWDFWIVQSGIDYHMFFLQAPQSLGDPDRRHRSATIGHAVSTDLRRWRELPEALAPGPAGSWDDIATWTGCVIPTADGWRMFYTGIGSPEGPRVQRIGCADSKDLVSWKKHPDNPITARTGDWYAGLDTSVWHNEGWRDPWVYETEGTYRMLITARASTGGEPRTRGVVAAAESSDGTRWSIRPPLAAPGIAGDLEVPQLLHHEDRWYLLFCTARWSDEQTKKGLSGPTNAYLCAWAAEGPFQWSRENVLTQPDEGLFGGRIVSDIEGDLQLLTWQRVLPDGSFGGFITDPIPLDRDSNGRLTRRDRVTHTTAP